ncbi:Polynucleotide 5'-hydroxyl-kinase grc3 [Onygenales sp. PD_12]|nr:Polynucleotide 5'-hydroxyl-kinase grc3 [Onygenales sp. PD_12]
MKRKGASQPPAPVSAIAARRLREQQKSAVADSQAVDTVPEQISTEEPPLKKPKTSSKRSSRDNSEKRQLPQRERRTEGKYEAPQAIVQNAGNAEEIDIIEAVDEYLSDVSQEEEEEASITSEDEDSDAPLANAPTEFQNFLLSKTRLTKSNIVYRTENAICIRLKLKMKNLALIGQYDLWVKRGVVSVMGAKLHPNPRLYRIYAPSTHSLPVIKCVSGVEDYAEIEIRSCNNGLFRLKNLSNLYHRIWNSKEAVPGSILQTEQPVSYSILHSSSDDPLKRHLRPLHLEKKWSMSIQALSQRGGSLRVLTCGPKGSGKSTFNKYLLNHLLSRPPSDDRPQRGQDGVAFLDLDPGQPELAPMGQVYLAHLRSPILGPPFSHPTVDSMNDGEIIRSHYIGANSPKDDPDHYIMSTMDLINRYQELLQRYPQCPLIINYPGWIFGLGLEIVISLVGSLGLSDLVYMSEKGPMEVVEPLSMAASHAAVPMTILPSQPTDFVTRSSAQLRSMQMLSYFHSTQHQINTAWSDVPLWRTKPMTVNYSGISQGILGVMVTGSHHDPSVLRDLLDGAIVGVVAIESLEAIATRDDEAQSDDPSLANGNTGPKIPEEANFDHDGDFEMQPSVTPHENQSPSSPTSPDEQPPPPHPSISRTPRENIPYISTGNGTSTPLNPNLSHCLGQALIRSINPTTETLDLYTPIPASAIHNALEQGNHLILVRGQADNPNWAISEEYFSARAAQRRHRRLLAQAKADGIKPDAASRREQEVVSERLRERVRRAGNVPWMRLDEQQLVGEGRERNMFRLRKKAYQAEEGSGSEREW